MVAVLAAPLLAVGPVADAATGPTAVLHLDLEQDPFTSGSVVHDAAGVARGTVVTDKGWLTAVTGNPGRGVRYPCPTCGKAVIELPDAAALDPGAAAFEVALDVRMTAEQGARSANLVQKGYWAQADGQYKLQVDNGWPGCVVNGSRGRVVVVTSGAAANVADGGGGTASRADGPRQRSSSWSTASSARAAPRRRAPSPMPRRCASGARTSPPPTTTSTGETSTR